VNALILWRRDALRGRLCGTENTVRVISGTLRGRNLRAPKGQNLRPTSDQVKETLFNMIGGDIREAVCLDLFAGTGNVGIEALSRHAAHVVFVEKAPEHFRVLKENLATCGVEANATVFCGDANILLRKLQKSGMTFDVIYLDPPYRQTNMLFDMLGRIADMAMLNADGQVIVEHASAHEMPPLIHDALELTKSRRVGDTTLSFYRPRILPA